MNTISVKHYDRKDNQIGTPFKADLDRYMAVNKQCDFIDWSTALTAFFNGRTYKTVNMPYGNIALTLVLGELHNNY